MRPRCWPGGCARAPSPALLAPRAAGAVRASSLLRRAKSRGGPTAPLELDRQECTTEPGEIALNSLTPAPPTVAAAAARYSFVPQLLADARFYRALAGADGFRPLSLPWTMLSNRGLWLLTFHRVAHYCLRRRQVRSPIWWCARLFKGIGTCFNVLFCRSAFSADCEIGGAAYLSNGGYLLCGARSIGAGSLIHDRCTFGYTVADGGEGRPVIGRDVWVGPNCIIAGSLTIGDGATVLPGTFLTFSVAARAVVKGNPAVLVRKDFDNSMLRRSLSVVQDVAVESP